MRGIAVLAALCAVASASDPYVRRKGSVLMLDGKPFRAAGANIYWAGLDENAENSTHPKSVQYPHKFCVRDAFETAALMGARVVRCHTCGISLANEKAFETPLGVFHDKALHAVDYAVTQAAANGIRLIVPLINQWADFNGGKYTIMRWLNISDQDEFYTSPRAIAAYKQYITAILDHNNSITGVRYGDDPTVAIWETGNELRYNDSAPPVEWTRTIAQHIKSLSPNHLVMDGTNGVNPLALGIEEVDVYSQHFYPGPPAAEVAQAANLAASAGKAFLVGEYGWKTSALGPFLAMAESNRNVSADLYWSLFPHRVDRGFVEHGGRYTLHFPNGDGHPRAVEAIRAHGFAMANGPAAPVPGYPAPPAPLITDVSDGGGIAWRGAAGAMLYTVQASSAPSGSAWVTVCDQCASDSQTPITMPKGYGASDWFRVQGVAPDRATAGPWSEPATGGGSPLAG